jgi:DNA-binding CsgD family transcriptional regulator
MRPPLDTILEQLDFGLVWCTERGERVLFANTWARAAVPGLDLESPLPPLLRVPLLGEMGSRGFLHEYSRPIKLTVDTRRVTMRFKCLGEPANANGCLVILSRMKVRRDDIHALLVERFALSKRECDIAMMVRDGFRNEEIADKLSIAVGTVKHYLHRIFGALEVRSRAELVRFLDRRARDTTQDV